MLDINHSFCVLPFYSREKHFLGEITPCCLLPPTHDLDAIKKSMLRGIRHSDCSRCWELEDSGHKSDRMIKNDTLDYLLDKDIRFIAEDCEQGNHKSLIYKLSASNICDAACVTCNSGQSSRWAGIDKSMGIVPKKLYSVSKQDLDEFIDYGSALHISLLGGEPTLDDNTYHILESLIKNDNLYCSINLLTNGRNIPKDLLGLLDRFPRRSLTYSIDGIGEAFDYIRWPHKWESVSANLLDMRDRGFGISSNVTVSNLNIMRLGEIDHWMRDNQIPYSKTMVHGPRYFAPNVLPIHAKARLSFGRELVDMDRGHELFGSFCSMIKAQDRAKKINIRDHLPEIADLIDSVGNDLLP